MDQSTSTSFVEISHVAWDWIARGIGYALLCTINQNLLMTRGHWRAWRMAYATGDSSKTARLERHKDRTLVIVNDSFGNIRTIALVNLLFNFYRATLCASAVFAVVRCPSVTLVHCIHTADDIVKLRVLPGSPIILVLLLPAMIPKFQGEPHRGSTKYTGVWKLCDCRQKSPFISETVREK